MQRCEGEVRGKATFSDCSVAGVGRRNVQAPKHKRMTHNTNKKLTYNLIRRGTASHPALQLALGVLDGMLCGIRCDDRWA